MSRCIIHFLRKNNAPNMHRLAKKLHQTGSKPEAPFLGNNQTYHQSPRHLNILCTKQSLCSCIIGIWTSFFGFISSSNLLLGVFNWISLSLIHKHYRKIRLKHKAGRRDSNQRAEADINFWHLCKNIIRWTQFTTKYND